MTLRAGEDLKTLGAREKGEMENNFFEKKWGGCGVMGEKKKKLPPFRARTSAGPGSEKETRLGKKKIGNLRRRGVA